MIIIVIVNVLIRKRNNNFIISATYLANPHIRKKDVDEPTRKDLNSGGIFAMV